MRILYTLIVGLLFISCMSPVRKETPQLSPIPADVIESSSDVDSVKSNDIKESHDSYSKPENLLVSIENLEFLVNLNREKFEIWTNKNDYTFNRISNYEYFDVIIYSNGNTDLSLSIPKDNIANPSCLYQTYDNTEYQNLLREALDRGYKFISNTTSEQDKNVRFYNYKNPLYELSFYEQQIDGRSKYSVAIKK